MFSPDNEHQDLHVEAHEAADYISVLLLQLRLIARHAQLNSLLALLEDAYYCAFVIAHPPKSSSEEEAGPEEG